MCKSQFLKDFYNVFVHEKNYVKALETASDLITWCDANSSICAFLYVTCSELSSCTLNNQICYEPEYICVKHSRCQNGPLCYPMNMANQVVCPLIASTSIAVDLKLTIIDYDCM